MIQTLNELQNSTSETFYESLKDLIDDQDEKTSLFIDNFIQQFDNIYASMNEIIQNFVNMFIFSFN